VSREWVTKWVTNCMRERERERERGLCQSIMPIGTLKNHSKKNISKKGFQSLLKCFPPDRIFPFPLFDIERERERERDLQISILITVQNGANASFRIALLTFAKRQQSSNLFQHRKCVNRNWAFINMSAIYKTNKSEEKCKLEMKENWEFQLECHWENKQIRYRQNFKQVNSGDGFADFCNQFLIGNLPAYWPSVEAEEETLQSAHESGSLFELRVDSNNAIDQWSSNSLFRTRPLNICRSKDRGLVLKRWLLKGSVRIFLLNEFSQTSLSAIFRTFIHNIFAALLGSELENLERNQNGR